MSDLSNNDLLAAAKAEPTQPGRSKLDPHLEVIAELRLKKQMTYKAIQAWLAAHNIPTSIANLQRVCASKLPQSKPNDGEFKVNF